ncbi:major facilitator superfamily domain-containing protein [Absidia repens]|uniref:Major facilitator superfamily domain-containing protein n=1 Tax=Absidia repens TaxID=90262 RepID=A0A1X2I797_9FUNG|nr:major facilitator superfamily domain-containing protein [Absidia repens]
MLIPFDSHPEGKYEHCCVSPRYGSTSYSEYGATMSNSVEKTRLNDDKYITSTWTNEEEAHVRRKLDVHLMSFILVLTFVLNLDRTNLSNAMSDNMAADLGFTNDTVNLSIMVYSVLFALFTLPSNFITKKIGAHIWIPLMMNLWAIVTWCHAFIHDIYGFMTVRAMIAITEAGFIPACLVYLTAFYKTNELATRLAYFWGAQALASCFSGVMSFGVFRLDGWFDLQGWKWLFLIDGILTQIIGLIAFVYLPSSPANTLGLLRGTHGWFTKREQYIAVTRILRDDTIKEHQNKPLTWMDVKSTVTDTNLYIHLLITFVGSDKHGQVALHGLIGALWSLAGYILLFLLPVELNDVVGGKWTFYGIAIFSAASPSSHGMHIAWMSSNLAPIGKRTLALGAVIGAANINGVPGSMIYQSKDAPRYYHGNMICICLQVTVIGLWLFQRGRYVYKNTSRKAKWCTMTDNDKEVYLKTTSDIGSQRLDYHFNL